MLYNCLHTLVAGLLASSQYPEGPATGHFGTGFSWFPCVYKRMLRWFPRLQVATACFLCSPPDINLLDPYFVFMYMQFNHCHRATAHLQLNILLLLSFYNNVIVSRITAWGVFLYFSPWAILHFCFTKLRVVLISVTRRKRFILSTFQNS
jgi:hypothetical protein